MGGSHDWPPGKMRVRGPTTKKGVRQEARKKTKICLTVLGSGIHRPRSYWRGHRKGTVIRGAKRRVLALDSSVALFKHR